MSKHLTQILFDANIEAKRAKQRRVDGFFGPAQFVNAQTVAIDKEKARQQALEEEDRKAVINVKKLQAQKNKELKAAKSKAWQERMAAAKLRKERAEQVKGRGVKREASQSLNSQIDPQLTHSATKKPRLLLPSQPPPPIEESQLQEEGQQHQDYDDWLPEDEEDWRFVGLHPA